MEFGCILGASGSNLHHIDCLHFAIVYPCLNGVLGNIDSLPPILHNTLQPLNELGMVGPLVGLQLREHQHVVDIHLEGAQPWE